MPHRHRTGLSLTGSRRSVTIKDVARAAGVSPATVSYVINDRNKVTSEVDARVRRAVTALGYSRNNAALALRTGRRNVIGCIVPALLSPVFPEIARAVQRRAEDHGYATFVIDSGGKAGEQEAARVLSKHGVDGVVAVLDAHPKIIDPPLFPVVVIDREMPGLDSVRADHEAGGRLIADYAAGKGHTRVGLFSGEQGLSSSRQRRDGFLSAARGRLDVRWDVHVPLLPTLPDEAVEAIARMDVTLIACVNDLVGMAVLSALRRMRVAVPDQVAVVGFDDMQWSSWPLIDLTTVRQPLAELGHVAVELLVRRLDDPLCPTMNRVMPVELIRRGSA